MKISRKNITQAAGIIVLLGICAVIVVFALKNNNQLIGEWYDPSTGLYVDFVDNQNIVWLDPKWSNSLEGVQGTYTITDGNTINLDFPDAPGLFKQVIGSTTWTYVINGNSLTLDAPMYNYTLQKQPK